MKDVMKNFGSNLKQLRHIADLTQSELAQILGVATNTVAYYEQGIKTPRLEMVIKIADFFHISIDNLIRGKKIDITSKNGSLNFVFPSDCSNDWLDRMIPAAENLVQAMKDKQAKLH